MIESKINLARKFRSKNFDQIVGQTLSVRMLKNSLYLGHYFPVYLFSGQRGCGKTTTARVFSAAINCKNLEHFQKNPKLHTIPCAICDSCLAMIAGTHPDFIEIDAASHTGVDNVRQIIDASSLLPLMGIKKIYLIDEAHMLSKAAFNAFLKILEEPPINTIFILATTDPEKIIDTVRSRCFQLLFRAVQEPVLLEHLKQVCVAEHITVEKEALSLIVHETDGSVRDSLNIIEQVRFAHGVVTKTAVLSVLNHLDTESYCQIIGFIICRDTHGLLAFLKQIQFDRFSADHIWRRFIELVRTLVWVKYGVSHNTGNDMDSAALKSLASRIDSADINRILCLIYKNEEIFLKTTAQHLFLEMFFIQLCLSFDTGLDKDNSDNHDTSYDHNSSSNRSSTNSVSKTNVQKNALQGAQEKSVRESSGQGKHGYAGERDGGQQVYSENRFVHESGSHRESSILEGREEVGERALENSNLEEREIIQSTNKERVKKDLVKDDSVQALQEQYREKWDSFLAKDAVKSEPLVHSVLSQGTCIGIELDDQLANQLNNQAIKVLVQLPKRLSLFETVINDAQASWRSSFEDIFSKGAQLCLCFTQENSGQKEEFNERSGSDSKGVGGHSAGLQSISEQSFSKQDLGKQRVSGQTVQQINEQDLNLGKQGVVREEFQNREYALTAEQEAFQSAGQNKREIKNVKNMQSIDISDKLLWQKTHMVLQHFPGIVREIV